MLVAHIGHERIDAAIAERGQDFRCPKCKREVILKKGRKVIAHFAHKPPTNCTWAIGETRAHLEAKLLVEDALARRGLKAQVECIVSTLSGDRRADVMAWSPKGLQIAFELQHNTSIGLCEIERRSFSYARAGIAQIWIPFIRPSVWKDGESLPTGDWFVRRYSAQPFEKWVYGLNGRNGMWMYDPAHKMFWLARLKSHQIYVKGKSWYSEGGEENYAPEYYRWSKKYRELTLQGPYAVDKLLIKVSTRRAFSTEEYNWPIGRIAHLVPDLKEGLNKSPSRHSGAA